MNHPKLPMGILFTVPFILFRGILHEARQLALFHFPDLGAPIRGQRG